MSPDDFANMINSQKNKIAQAFNREIPVKVGNEAVRFVHDNFRKSGFVNNGLQRWMPAKRQGNAKGALGSYKTLMSGRNHLFQSTRKETSPGMVKIINDCDYAAVHNEGLRAGRGKGFQMPKRQFIGDSPELDSIVTNSIADCIDRLL